MSFWLKAAWLLTFVAGVAVGTGEWLWAYQHPEPTGLTRWQDGGSLAETKAFAEMVNHRDDRSEWQSGPLGPQVFSGELPDFALPRVSVYSVPNVHPAQARPTLRDLGDRAQVKTIDAIEHAAGSALHPWDDLKKALNGDDEPGERDPYLFERVLVATVAKGVKWPPGDRMVWTRIFVKPINFKFAAYTIAATENETIKVSSVEATNVRKLSADIGLTIPGIDAGKISLAPSTEKTVKTTSDVSAQYERLGVDIMPVFLRVIRESGAGGDVIGNTKVALSMTTDPKMILAEKNLATREADIHLVVTAIHLEDDVKTPTMEVLPLVPLPHCALRARISAIYEQRHVLSGGGRFYDESKHQVVFIHDVDAEREVELVGADDVSPFVWSIKIVRDGSTSDTIGEHEQLSAKFGKTGQSRPLVFSDYGRAVKLAHWVRTHEGKPVSGYNFNWTAGQGLFVSKQPEDECRAANTTPVPERR